MGEKLLKWLMFFFGASIGVAIGIYQSENIINAKWFEVDHRLIMVGAPILFGLILGLLFFMLSATVMRFGLDLIQYTQRELDKIPPQEMIFGVLGLIVGLLIAFLISRLYAIVPIPYISDVLSVLTYLFLGILGVNVANRKGNDIIKLPELFKKSETQEVVNCGEHATDKVLDTSVIIDGRIADLCKSGFMEGKLIIPEFVLKELQHIADSSDSLKRAKGRRGLDILAKIQSETSMLVEIVDTDFEDVPEVDIKLIKLAQSINGAIMTNDFNLNKVASLQNVKILNINDLANALKPVLLPGERMTVNIIKEGKEPSQGVAYLDDGTMIVVEDGRSALGTTTAVRVTSVLQTSAGRMIFARLFKED